MFTFIHTADIHLDSPLLGLSHHESAPEDIIRGATRKGLENIVNLALEKQVDFVVIAGDLYDGDWPDHSTGQFFTNQIRRLRGHGILVYLIAGNHDAASKITRSLSLPENVIRFSHKKPETHLHPGLPAALHGQGFAHQAEQENLAVNYPAAAQDRFNIGILHTSLAGNIDHDTYAPCSIADLNAREYDYWALGHVHQRAMVQESPAVVFPGNPQGRHIKETGERGCYLVTVNDDLEIAETEFIGTDIVRWSHPEIDLTNAVTMADILENAQSTMQRLLTEVDDTERLQLGAFRLTFTGSTPLHGQLHTTLGTLQAECHEIAQDLDPHRLWLERVKLRTTPTIDLAELATRDQLSALVIEAIENFTPTTPNNIKKLADKLGPLAQKQDLAELFNPESEQARQLLHDDIAAIVLQSITHSAE